MPSPEHFNLSATAYANMDKDAQAELLFEFLDELRERLAWVDDEMARHGFCAQCVMADGARFDHDCRERRW